MKQESSTYLKVKYQYVKLGDKFFITIIIHHHGRRKPYSDPIYSLYLVYIVY